MYSLYLLNLVQKGNAYMLVVPRKHEHVIETLFNEGAFSSFFQQPIILLHLPLRMKTKTNQKALNPHLYIYININPPTLAHNTYALSLSKTLSLTKLIICNGGFRNL